MFTLTSVAGITWLMFGEYISELFPNHSASLEFMVLRHLLGDCAASVALQYPWIRKHCKGSTFRHLQSTIHKILVLRWD